MEQLLLKYMRGDFFSSEIYGFFHAPLLKTIVHPIILIIPTEKYRRAGH